MRAKQGEPRARTSAGPTAPIDKLHLKIDGRLKTMGAKQQFFTHHHYSQYDSEGGKKKLFYEGYISLHLKIYI
jgi:hypothetical protein